MITSCYVESSALELLEETHISVESLTDPNGRRDNKSLNEESCYSGALPELLEVNIMQTTPPL